MRRTELERSITSHSVRVVLGQAPCLAGTLRVLLVGVLCTGLIGVVQVTAAPQAQAVPGLVRQTDVSENNDEPEKLVQVDCPEDKLVTGGGATISGGNFGQTMLTASQPVGHTGWLAMATTHFSTGGPDWSLRVFAVCADEDALEDYSIPFGSVTGTAKFQQTAAVCPAGTVAYGSGARAFLNDPNPLFAGRVGLQLIRTSGPMDISRTTGRMLNGPFVNEWTLRSFAMCARPSGNIHVEGTLSQSNTASKACETGRVHGPGGGGGLIDGGSVHLREIFVGPTLREPVRVTFTSTPPPSIGTIVHMTCAT